MWCVAFLFVGVFGASWAHADIEVISEDEVLLREALRKRAPEHLATAVKAYDARQRKDHVQAAALYGEVNAGVPEFSAGLRRQCLSLIELKKRTEGLALCREAQRLEPSVRNHVALTAALLSTEEGDPWHVQGSVEEARFIIRRAVEMDPASVSAHEMRCRVGLELNSLMILRECSERLEALAPDSVNTKLYIMYRALAEDDLDTAHEALNEARELGMSHSAYLFLNTRIVGARPFYYWWAPQLRLGVAIWALLVTLLAMVTWLLDRRQRMVMKELKSSTVLASQATERRWRRWHNRFLWACCMAYCITAPLLMMLALWLFGAAVYGAIDMELLPEQTIWMIAALVVCGVGWLTRHVWRAPRERSPGTSLNWDDVPEAQPAREMLDEQAVGEVQMLMMDNASHVRVVEGGTLMHQLEGTRERRIELGRDALVVLTPEQLQAVLMAEQRRLNASAGFAVRVRRATSSMLADLHRRGAATLFNPRWVLLSLFNRVFCFVSEGAVAYEALLSDVEAAERYGADTLDGALSLVAPAPDYDVSLQLRRARLASLLSTAPLSEPA